MTLPRWLLSAAISIGMVLTNPAVGWSDGGPLTQSMIAAVATKGINLNYPMGLAIDRAGNLFVADTLNNVVREIVADGRVFTIAGNGRPKYSGDNGPALAASLNHPAGVAVDANGNLYINDENNFVVRKVSANHVISTVVGTGKAGYSGDGGPATKAQIAGALGLALDTDGNLFIADTGNCVIRKINKRGIISTVVGSGQAAYFGDGGPARLASLRYPTDVTFDADGDMYIADYFNGAVRKVNRAQFISTVAGNGEQAYGGDLRSATVASLHGPVRVAVDSGGNLYIETDGDGRIRRVSSDSTISTIAGSGVYGDAGDGGPAALASLRSPYGMTLDKGRDALYIADTGNSRVRVVRGTAYAINVPLTATGPGPVLHSNVEVGVFESKDGSTAWYFSLTQRASVTFRLPPTVGATSTLYRTGIPFKPVTNPTTLSLDAGSYHIVTTSVGHVAIAPRADDTLAAR